MQRNQSSFYRKTLPLMAPIVLQQLITIRINFMDNLRKWIQDIGRTERAAEQKQEDRF